MTFIVILVLAVLMMGADTVRRVWTDGSGPDLPPRSHFDDPGFHRSGR